MAKSTKNAYEIIKKVTICLAALALLSGGVYFFCGKMISADYSATVERIKQENLDNEIKFNENLDAMRANQSLSADNGNVSPETEPLETWNCNIEGSEWIIEDISNQNLVNTRVETCTRNDLMNGGLLLINAWHELPEDFSEEGMINVGSTSNFSIQVEDNTVKLFPCAFEALSECLNAAKTDGMDYYIVREGYRSKQTQSDLFNARMQKLSGSYSGNRLIEETKKSVNYPGTSDYNSGMTVRMDVYQKGVASKKFQAETEQGAWLTNNCWKYGFIFRFPSKDFPNASWEDKGYKTGVTSQLNMYRYVGKAHSTVMKAMNFCLEEYIEFLQKHSHISIYQDDALKYEIVRINAGADMPSYNLPVLNQSSDYQASLDNMGGIIIAYFF